MPSDDGLRLEDFHRIQHLGSQVIEPRKHQAIDIADGYPLGRPAPQHIELMPKGENFGLQGCARRNSPATAYQINLRRSPIAVIIDLFAGDRQLFWVYGRCGRPKNVPERLRHRYAGRGQLTVLSAVLVFLTLRVSRCACSPAYL